MVDLFASNAQPHQEYDARRSRCWRGWSRSGGGRACTFGGVDERAFHHLAAEVLDNSMDEAVAGYASRIEIRHEPAIALPSPIMAGGIPGRPASEISPANPARR
jgi:topoisomerase-4 subunit B